MKKLKNITLPGMNVPDQELAVNLSIGPLFDTIYCEFLKGKYGETIVNGGLPHFAAIIGSVNNYKTTISLHMMMMGIKRVIESEYPTKAEVLDTEMSMKVTRILQLAKHMDKDGNLGLVEYIKKYLHISDPNIISTNDWVNKFNDYCEEKEKDKNLDVEFESIIDPVYNKTTVRKLPTFLMIDTWTKFTNNKALEKVADNDLDDSTTNTLFMSIGMFKKKFLLSLPRNLSRSNTYAVLTAHVGEKINMETGPAMYIKPSKQLQYLKGGDEIEGGTKDFKQTPNLMFQAHTAKPLTVKKGAIVLPEYPMHENDTSTDLNVVTLTTLRNKSGQSGVSIPVVVSQTEGVKPWLSAFHFLKEVGKFGMSGNDKFYHLDIYPDIKLSRTTIREKIETDSRLRRALEVTSDIHQLLMTRDEFRDMKYSIPTTKLYEKIKQMGYDWNRLLDTRGYTLIDNYNKDYVPYLSTVDILNIYLEEYHPYWYEKDNITNSYIK